jgi:GT2 family glycosyltransferase
MNTFSSVIIPTYNRDQILCNTIEQVLHQDFKDFELLIIDQTEKHDAFTENFLDGLPDRVKIIKIKKPNLPAARNIGIQNSRGNIIVFFDDDMIIPSDTLNKLAYSYQNADLIALTGFVLYPGQPDETKWLGHKSKFLSLRKIKTKKYFAVDDFRGYFMSFRKEVFERVGYFDEWIGTQPISAAEDFEFSLRLKKAGIKLFLDTSITLTHLGEKSGGCERRNLDPILVKNTQTQMLAYSLIKNYSSKSQSSILIPLWKFIRSAVLNRSLVRSKLKMDEISGTLKSFFVAVRQIKEINTKNG